MDQFLKFCNQSKKNKLGFYVTVEKLEQFANHLVNSLYEIDKLYLQLH